MATMYPTERDEWHWREEKLIKRAEAAESRAETLQRERDDLIEDSKWRHRWHDKLGRGQNETEGKFYERLEQQRQALAALSARWRDEAADEQRVSFHADDLDALIAGDRALTDAAD